MIRGRFDFRLDGRPWLTLNNGVTYEGLDSLLDAEFTGASAITPYVGLIAESGFSALSSSDTHASHPGWNEWTQYSGNRPAWNAAAATGGRMGTSVAFQWVMSAGGQLRGAFIASQAAKTTGPGAIIYCTAAAAAALTVVNLQVITCTYILTLEE